MKKLFVAVALVMGMGTSVALTNNTMNASVATVVMADEYAPIELKDLPQAIQDAVAKNYAGSAIKEAHVKTAEDGTKTYKLVLVNAEQAESTVLFNDKGEEVKEAECKK